MHYLSHEGKPVRIVFTFTSDGKILQTRCELSPPAAQPGISCDLKSCPMTN